MSEWEFAQSDAAQRLARIHHFSVLKRQDGRDVEFLISVREFVTPPDPAMKFYASADRQTNQKSAPYLPAGWGSTLLQALSSCLEEIERFPYEGE